MNRTGWSQRTNVRRYVVTRSVAVMALSGLVAVVGLQATKASIARATGSPTPTISNIPSSAIPGGSFTPAVSTNEDGTTSVTSATPTVCTVNQDGSVSYLAFGTCSLISHVVPTQTTIGPTFGYPTGVAVNVSGNVFVADENGATIEEVTASGRATPFASGFAGTGGLAVDAAGNMYVTDALGNQVDEVSAAGGSPAVIASGFYDPTGVAVDASGNVYVADSFNNQIEELSPNGLGGYNQTNFATGFSHPTGVAVDASGNVYVADTLNGQVEKISPEGGGDNQVTIGSGFDNPTGVAVDASGNVYVADSGNNRVEELIPDGAGSYNQITIGGGFENPQSVAVDAAGNVFVADTFHNRVEEIYPMVNGSLQSFEIQPIISDVPSSASVGGSFTPSVSEGASLGTTSVTSSTPSVCNVNQDGSVSYRSVGTCSLVSHVATSQHTIGSGFSNPNGVAVDASGNLYVADPGNNQVEEISPTGAQTTFCSGFNAPFGIAVDALGNVYVSNPSHNEVVKISPGGVQSVIGSNFINPFGVAVDASGNVFVADSGHNLVDKIDPLGGQSAIGSNGLSVPIGVAVDASDNVYIADGDNGRVVKVSPSRSQTTLASGFVSPKYVAVDTSGNVFVSDASNGEVDEISPTDTKTILGTGFSRPQGVAVDASGNVYVADAGNHRVEEIIPAIDGSTQSFEIRPNNPVAPTAISAVAGNQSAVVSWTNPASNGDATAHNEVQYSTNGTTWTTASATIPASATSYTVTGLTNGQAYHVRVIALDGSNNASAPDTMSAVVRPVAPPPRVVKPGAPTRASAVTHGTSVTISWQAPSSNGGGAITHYKATLNPGNKYCTTTKLTCVISGLSAKKRYSISITATNSVGVGPAATLGNVRG